METLTISLFAYFFNWVITRRNWQKIIILQEQNYVNLKINQDVTSVQTAGKIVR